IRAEGDIPNGFRVGEALAFSAAMRPNWDQAYADKLVTRFGLKLRKRYSTLSRGQKSAVGVVIGLASRAPLTLFDEGYLGLDAPVSYAFYEELLEDYMAHPRTIILSTHLIEEVANLLETVLILHDGKALLHESAATLLGKGAQLIGPEALIDE